MFETVLFLLLDKMWEGVLGLETAKALIEIKGRALWSPGGVPGEEDGVDGPRGRPLQNVSSLPSVLLHGPTGNGNKARLSWQTMQTGKLGGWEGQAGQTDPAISHV